MKSGCRTVSISLAMFALLASPHAGREWENGTGAMRVAPELIGSLATRAQRCSQTTAQTSVVHTRELDFGMIEPGDEEQLVIASREVVRFEWRPATGELTYDTDAPTGMFSDLAVTYPASARSAPTCESH